MTTPSSPKSTEPAGTVSVPTDPAAESARAALELYAAGAKSNDIAGILDAGPLAAALGLLAGGVDSGDVADILSAAALWLVVGFRFEDSSSHDVTDFLNAGPLERALGLIADGTDSGDIAGILRAEAIACAPSWLVDAHPGILAHS